MAKILCGGCWSPQAGDASCLACHDPHPTWVEVSETPSEAIEAAMKTAVYTAAEGDVWASQPALDALAAEHAAQLIAVLRAGGWLRE